MAMTRVIDFNKKTYYTFLQLSRGVCTLRSRFAPCLCPSYLFLAHQLLRLLFFCCSKNLDMVNVGCSLQRILKLPTQRCQERNCCIHRDTWAQAKLPYVSWEYLWPSSSLHHSPIKLLSSASSHSNIIRT